MPRCECGAYVTADYARVFATNDGTVTKCLACAGFGAYSPAIADGGERKP